MMATAKNGRKLPKGIRQRSAGGYEGRFMVNGESYTVHGRTIKETQDLITETKYKVAHGTFVKASDVTFGEFFNTWIDQYKSLKLKPGTLATYQSIYNGTIKGYLEDKKLSSIRPEHLQKFFNELAKNGYADGTIEIAYVVVSGCLKQAKRNKLIENNPAEYVELPKQGIRKSHIAMTKEQQQLFMEAAKQSYLYNLFAVMLRTGMRSGEIRALRYSDVDKKKGVIHIQRTLKQIRGFSENSPKSKTSLRDIPLTDDIIYFLDAQKHLYHFKTESIDRYLFCNENGNPLRSDRIQAEIDRIIKSLGEKGEGFPRITSHCFRHTFATRAIEAGMPPQVLKTILGHSSLAMTMDLYSHVMPDTKADEMAKIAGIF